MSRLSRSWHLPGDESVLGAAVNTLVDNATMVKNYGLLSKATEGGGGSGDTPGYIYKDLTELTFQGPRVGAAVAQTLTKRLAAAQDVQSKVKTLKTIRHLAQNGSKSFRNSLRKCDEHLKGAADAGTEMSSSARSLAASGDVSGVDHGGRQVRALAAEIRVILFDQAIIEADDSPSPEEPTGSVLPPGMGSSNVKTDGKYEGFGTAPPKETVTDKMIDMVEQMLSFPDERREVLELCLAAPSTGEYQPVDLPALKTPHCDPSVTPRVASSIPTHVPGKAGGGWESDSDSGDVTHADEIDEVALEACEGQTPPPASASRKSSVEMLVLDGFLRRPGNVDLVSVEACFQRLIADHKMQDIIREMNSKFAEEMDKKDTLDKEIVLKLILLLEFFLRSDNLTGCEQSLQSICSQLDVVSSNEAKTDFPQQIVIKAKKVKIITEFVISSST